MSDTGGDDSGARQVTCSLGTEFELEPGASEDVCVDLDGEWREDSEVKKHPDLVIPNLEFVTGSVGEGGDHVNITFKNLGDEKIVIAEDRNAIVIIESKSEAVKDGNENQSEDTAADNQMEVDNTSEPLKDVNEPESEVNGDDAEKNKQQDDSARSNDAEAEKEVKVSGEDKTEEKKDDSDEGKKMDSNESNSEQMDTDPTAEEETVSANNKTEDKETERSDESPKPKEDESSEGEKEVSQEKNSTSDVQTEQKASSPKMMFVNETAEDDKDKEKSSEDKDEMETDSGLKENGSDTKENGSKEKSDRGDGKDNGDDKPTIKLASFSSMATSAENGHSNNTNDNEDGCYSCKKYINCVFDALVWETMQFCEEECVAKYQTQMANCASCKKEVLPSSLGKYCVRFGCDIQQFCSNVCLEDYKKGLKVCSYCQKDISGGEGFLAPIGDKGQFKDFCQQKCLQKYEHMHFGKPPDPEMLPCNVCKETKKVEVEILKKNEIIKLCGQPCYSAFKFGNQLDATQCELCSNYFDVEVPKVFTYFSGKCKVFCSKPCQNVFVMKERKIVACSYCKVKKYNFDMIEKFPAGQTSNSSLFCSINCLNLSKPNSSSTMPMQSRPSPMPVISAVSSLAMPQNQLGQQIPVQTQTVREVVRETTVLQSDVVAMRNKSVGTKPMQVSKGVNCKPTPCHKETQTEGLTQPVPIPIPVPIHLPTPVKMYNAPYPVPVPIPLPFPVPVFIPTTRRSIKGIEKCIKKILNKIPADPFEAELLALAGDIAGGDDSDDSGSDHGNYDDDDYDNMMPIQTPQVPAPDLENEMSAEKVVPKPLPVSTPDPMERQRMMQTYKREREEDDPDDPDAAWKPKAMWDQSNRGRRPTRTRGGRSNQQVKRFRADQDQIAKQQQAALQAIQQQPKERPDANHHLKFTYGVNAWKHWVVGKNAELEKLRAQGKYQKSFETDILKLRADELNFTLCMFVKEVKKPNGDAYAADSIFYLVLGIQEYLFENSRIDNIFTDVYYDPFTSALHEVVKDFKLPVNELGYFVTRIEEEHLWESKQLGAHSPQVLLNTLVYFNTKYFQLKTPDQHLKLSFSHIMKHWKKANIIKQGQQQRTVLLRYYPPPAKGQRPDDRKMYEQHENHENPLRCPVKLYEFYLSKCPESVKNRNDMFYLQPERSCVPDSPVWYSTQLFNRFSLEKMLARLMMVREVQEHMLADQNS